MKWVGSNLLCYKYQYIIDSLHNEETSKKTEYIKGSYKFVLTMVILCKTRKTEGVFDKMGAVMFQNRL